MTSQKSLKLKFLLSSSGLNPINLEANNGKLQVMLTTDDKLKFNGRGSLICNETTVKLLGTTVDDALSFYHQHLHI